MKLIRYEATRDKPVNVGVHTLAGQVLGVYVTIGRWCYSLVWCKPTCRGLHQ